MNQQVEPNPYPPMRDTIIFFGKFLISASFILAFLFVFTNAIFVDGYYGQLTSFLPETIVYYLTTIIVVALVTYIGINALGNKPDNDRETTLLDIYTYFGFIAFLVLSLMQFQFQSPNYHILQDPYLLQGFAWQVVLFWWLASFSLFTWAIILFLMKIKMSQR